MCIYNIIKTQRYYNPGTVLILIPLFTHIRYNYTCIQLYKEYWENQTKKYIIIAQQAKTRSVTTLHTIYNNSLIF